MDKKPHTDALVSFFQNSVSEQFESFDLRMENTPTASSVHRLFKGLTEHPTLEDIEINVTGGERLNILKQCLIRDSDLRPLFKLAKLCHLSLSFLPFDIQDGTVEDIATSWPHIRVLNLGTASVQRLSRVSIRSLYPLTGCRELDFLGLVVDARRSMQTTLLKPDNMRKGRLPGFTWATPQLMIRTWSQPCCHDYFP